MTLLFCKIIGILLTLAVNSQVIYLSFTVAYSWKCL